MLRIGFSLFVSMLVTRIGVQGGPMSFNPWSCNGEHPPHHPVGYQLLVQNHKWTKFVNPKLLESNTKGQGPKVFLWAVVIRGSIRVSQRRLCPVTFLSCAMWPTRYN